MFPSKTSPIYFDMNIDIVSRGRRGRREEGRKIREEK